MDNRTSGQIDNRTGGQQNTLSHFSEDSKPRLDRQGQVDTQGQVSSSFESKCHRLLQAEKFKNEKMGLFKLDPHFFRAYDATNL